jgi:hypothetical protein
MDRQELTKAIWWLYSHPPFTKIHYEAIAMTLFRLNHDDNIVVANYLTVYDLEAWNEFKNQN